MGAAVYRYRLLHYEKGSLWEAYARLLALLTRYGYVAESAVVGVSRRSLLTLLRSPHVNKKSREQFTTVYYTLTFRVNLAGSTAPLAQLESDLRVLAAAEGFLPHLVLQRELQVPLVYRRNRI
jgi:ribosomal protein S10